VRDVPFNRMPTRDARHCCNFVPGTQVITLKSMMARTLRDFYSRRHRDGSAVPMPLTYVVWPGKDSSDRRKFLRNENGRIWIAKPSGGAKGQRIFITSHRSAALRHIDEDMGAQAWVLQEYICRPLLLPMCEIVPLRERKDSAIVNEGLAAEAMSTQPPGRKFDLRVWALLDADMNVCLYREGVLRTCTSPFSLETLQDPLAHLTNHCVQEELAEEFGKYEEGNELMLDGLSAVLESRGHSLLPRIVWPQVKAAVLQSLLAAHERKGRQSFVNDRLTRPTGFSAFQVLGYDFILDETLRLHLIEVNAAPAVTASLLPTFASELIRIVVDGVTPELGVSQSTQLPAAEFELLSMDITRYFDDAVSQAAQWMHEANCERTDIALHRGSLATPMRESSDLEQCSNDSRLVFGSHLAQGNDIQVHGASPGLRLFFF
jgi:hypothetical protein